MVHLPHIAVVVQGVATIRETALCMVLWAQQAAAASGSLGVHTLIRSCRSRSYCPQRLCPSRLRLRQFGELLQVGRPLLLEEGGSPVFNSFNTQLVLTR